MKVDISSDRNNRYYLYRSSTKKAQKAYIWGIFIALFTFIVIGYLLIDKTWPKLQFRLTNNWVKPELTIKSYNGKECALLWLAEHYPDAQTLDELELLIAQGHAEAIIVKAQLFR